MAVLGQAFAEDPMARYVLGVSPLPLDESLNALFRFACEVRLLLGWPLLGAWEGDAALAGVAGVTMPGPVDWPPALQQVYADLGAQVGPQAVSRLEAYSQLADTGRPSAPHYQLGMIGVHPEHQGSGHGGRLLQALIEMSEGDPASQGIWLDTEHPRNPGYYRRFGFEPRSQSRLGGVDIWGMYRPNR